MYKSRNKIVSKFIERLLLCRMMFKDILTFLGLDYRDTYNIVLCCPRNQYAKNNINQIIKSHKKSTCLKWTSGHYGNDYRVATLYKLYQTIITGITMQSLKSIGQI